MTDPGRTGAGPAVRVFPVALVLALALSVVAERPALALSVYVSHCGVLKAFVQPTSTTQGSITIGTVTYPILIGGGPATLGSSVCLVGGDITSGALAGVTLSPLPSVFCGDVRTFQPATAAAAGSVTIGLAGHAPGYDPTLIIPVGTTIPSPAIESRHCFSTGLNAAGDAIVTADVTPPSATAAPAGSPASAAKPTAPVLSRPSTMLPSTSTGSPTPAIVGIVMAIGMGLLTIVCLARRSS